MNFLPPDSDLTDPHDEINDMRLRWDIRFSETAGGRTALVSSWPASVWGLLAAALALALGAAGPWETALGAASESGLEQDGAIVIAVSVALAAAAVQSARYRSARAALACLIASAAGLAIAVADYRQASDGVGWGLQLVLMASLAAAALSVVVLLETRRGPR